MLKLNSKWLIASALAATLVAGCGDGGSTSGGVQPTPTNPATSAQGVDFENSGSRVPTNAIDAQPVSQDAINGLAR